MSPLLYVNDQNQPPMKAVAEMLNKEWALTPVRVHHLNLYYEAATARFRELTWSHNDEGEFERP